MPESRVNVNTLSPWQEFLSKKFPGRNAKFSTAQLEQAADEFFGPIPIPPGSQITARSGGYAEYIDPEGYKHIIRRELNGASPRAGEIQDNTNRPNILPPASGQTELTQDILGRLRGLSEQQQANALAIAKGETPAGLDTGIKSYLDQIEALSRQLQGTPTLAALSPEDQAALEQISAAEQAKLKQQFQEAQGTAIAQLFGDRLQQSSTGNDAIARLLQQQGLVSAEQLANAAARGLQARQYLTAQQQQRNQLALQGLLGAAGSQLEGFRARSGASQAQMDALNDLIKQFSGQQTQRDIASAGLTQQQRELAEGGRRSDLDYLLRQQLADLEVAKARKASDLFGNLAQGVGSSLLSYGLGALPPLRRGAGG